MLKLLSAVTCLAVASAAFAQTQPGRTTPSITPSDTPAVTPSQTPGVNPSYTPEVGGPVPRVGPIEERPLVGLSRCENLLAFERDKCLDDERAGGAATGGTAEGPGSRILIAPSGPQQTSPAAERDLQRCEALSGEEKERCMKDVRAAITAGEKQRGPEATGAGSSAGSGATTDAPSGAPR